MSTRGAVGIRMNNIDKVGYNHFDSYPTGLGNELIIWLKGMNSTKLEKLFNEIKLIDDYNLLTWDWDKHCLNNMFANSHDFLYDSLFCEYAYIVNLDTNMLEFYKGFNKDRNALGRYSNFKADEDSKYYGVKLNQEIPLDDLFEGRYKNDSDEGFRLKF